jgi:hypothetical protein
MPRSNPLARERVKDDEKHLDSLAHPFPFAGRGTSGESSAGSSQGSALQAPRPATGDQEVFENASSRGSPPTRGTPPLGALGPCRRKKPFARTEDSSPARLALFGVVGSNVDAREAPERRATSLRSPAWPHPPSTEGGDCAGAHGDSSSGVLAVRLHGRPEQRGTDLSQGRAHDRIVAAEIGRTASSSWKRAAPGRPDCERKRDVVGGNPGHAIVALPMEGAPDHPTRGGLSRDVTGGDLGRALAGTSTPSERGASSSRKRGG